LPGGFKKITEISRPMRDRKTPVTHLVFSDGLAGISVFIEDLGDRVDVNSGLSSQGSIQIYSRVSGDKLITVVGEVPPRTVIQVAESVRYAGQ
jgi:sigma-E factor negative regulatory protein RseB